MKNIILLLMVFSFSVFGCKKAFWKDDKLALQPTEYKGDQLKINGYFFRTPTTAAGRSTVYLFYENGVILHAGDNYYLDSLDILEARIQSDEFIERARCVKFSWGLFVVEGDNIKFERWYPGNPPLLAYVREGTILNDTTFHVTETYRFSSSGKKREIREQDEYYHFRSFSPKPDSTNSYVP